MNGQASDWLAAHNSDVLKGPPERLRSLACEDPRILVYEVVAVSDVVLVLAHLSVVVAYALGPPPAAAGAAPLESRSQK